jgi:hypothetical protein
MRLPKPRESSRRSRSGHSTGVTTVPDPQRSGPDGQEPHAGVLLGPPAVRTGCFEAGPVTLDKCHTSRVGRPKHGRSNSTIAGRPSPGQPLRTVHIRCDRPGDLEHLVESSITPRALYPASTAAGRTYASGSDFKRISGPRALNTVRLAGTLLRAGDAYTPLDPKSRFRQRGRCAAPSYGW